MPNQQLTRPIVNHIAFYVTDLANSTRFYSEVMQLENIPDPFKNGGYSWFKISDSCQLHLIAGARESARQHINHHLAFSISTFTEFVEHLKEANIPFYNPNQEEGKIHIRPDGIRQVFFKDPDGYWLEVNNIDF